jgi:predicted O-linked N-acetylglucosamine transferase (SPINDLY family)
VAAGQAERALELLGPDVLDAVDRAAGPAAVNAALALAGVFHQARRLDRAERYYLRALEAGPNVQVYINLGHICHFTGRMMEAVEWRRKAIALRPEDAALGADLAASLIFLGRKDEGLELFRKAAAASGDPAIHSMALMNLHYQPSLDNQALFEEHRRWADRHAPVSLARTDHANDRSPDRRLRIGYLSPDFRTHPVAYFFEPLLEGHDRTAVEVFGYSQVACPDPVTWRLQARFDCTRNICGLDDRAVATLIENDRIDVLVDLAGHTGGNRLTVFAHRPAPIQATYLGYPDTTGMRQVDYRLTDELSTPAELQRFYTEQLVYLPEGFLCYRPPEWAPQIPPPPSASRGTVTFGAFNDSCKVNAPLMALWARVLAATGGSRLLFKSRAGGDPQARALFLDQFRRAGISADQVTVVGQRPAIEYLRLYDQVDIALDTFPYNGTTTTCDALWMGVPVVSLVGGHHAGRVGLSILSRLGLETLAARSADEYVEKATALAQDLRGLEKLRASIRPLMMDSPLCNARAFAGAVEYAYRRMWQRWCRSGTGEKVAPDPPSDR